jgi:4-amino-4-deoxy-L-arabinose transferase-like glycosyltransferase
MAAEGRWALVVAAYAAAQVVLRLLIGPALELDEAEAMVNARRLAWGYGPQPPLYFWLQWAFFRLLGESLLALALLKAALLGGTVLVLLHLLAREGAGSAAGPAALSLGLLPQISWEAQRALTHSVLALLMAVIAAALFVRALRSGRLADHLWLGVALGLGILSKFNFAAWPLGLLAAAVVLPEWRGRLRPRLLLASGALTAVATAPALLWIARNPEAGLASQGKLGMAPDGGLAARIEGTGMMALAVLGFASLLLVAVGALAARRGGRPAPPPAAELLRLLLAAAVASLGLVWLGLLVSGTTEVRERWLMPLAWALAPAAVLWLWPRLGRAARRRLAAGLGAVWLLAAALLPYASLVDPGYRGADFGPLAAAVRGIAGPVVATDQWVAGNLVLRLPGRDVRLWDGTRPQGTFALVAPASDLGPALATLGLPAAPEGTIVVAPPRERDDEHIAVVPVGP